MNSGVPQPNWVAQSEHQNLDSSSSRRFQKGVWAKKILLLSHCKSARATPDCTERRKTLRGATHSMRGAAAPGRVEDAGHQSKLRGRDIRGGWET